MAGEHGPIPKRSSQRRRVNKPEVPVDTAPGRKAKPLPAGEKWELAARQWYESLAASGQSAFYEASDWASAWLIAESMSRELAPQPIVVGQGEDARVEMHRLPPKGASLAAWLKAMTALMATEGDRRRMRLELDRPAAGGPEKEREGVAQFSDYQRRLRSPAG